MESEFNDTQLLIQKTLRDYFTREIEPLVPDMEDGKLLCYEPIRKMMRDLGLGEASGELARACSQIHRRKIGWRCSCRASCRSNCRVSAAA